MTTSFGSKLRINPAVFTRKNGKVWVVLAREKGYYWKLNEAAGYIWSLLRTPKNISEITDRLIERFDVSPREAQKDTENFIKRYVRLGLLVENK